VKPTPDVPCIIIGGQTICGSVEYLDEVSLDANTVVSVISEYPAQVKAEICYAVGTITTAVQVALAFLDPAALVAYVLASTAGFDVAEIQNCMP
jgi:hypothetical protein